MRTIRRTPGSLWGLHRSKALQAHQAAEFTVGSRFLLLGALFALWPAQQAHAACAPAGPYNNAVNIIVCDPGAGEVIDTLSNHDQVTVNSGTVTSVTEGTGNDLFVLNDGSITAPGISVDQGNGNDTATILGGLVAGTISQGSGIDIYTHSVAGNVSDIDQGSGRDEANIGAGATIGTLLQGSSSDTATITGGNITTINQGSFADIFNMSAGNIGSVDQSTGNDEATITNGTVVGTFQQGAGLDEFTMSNGTLGSLDQGSDLDTATITGGRIIGLFTDGDFVTFSGGRIGSVNLRQADNQFFMSGNTQIDTFLIAEQGADLFDLSGGTIGTFVNSGNGDDRVIVDGTVIAGLVDMEGGADRFEIFSGSVGGNVITGIGDDRVILNGGTIFGNIDTGDDDDLITWDNAAAVVGVGGVNNGTINAGAGSDIIAIVDPTVDLSQAVLNGGDNTSSADGQVDVLSLVNGWSGDLVGANTTNFEIIYIDVGTVRFSDAAITVGDDPGIDASLSAGVGFPVTYGVIVDGGGVLDATNALSLTGNVNLRNGTLSAGNAGTNLARISGNVFNSAGSSVDLTSGGNRAGDRLRIGGNYTGGGTLRVDAALDASRQSDVLVIDGDVLAGATVLSVTDVGDGTGSETGTGVGRGIRVVDVSATGRTRSGDFVLANGSVVAGAYRYGLNLESDGIWYLQSVTRDIVAPAVSVPNIIEDIALTFAGTLHERVGEQELLLFARGQQQTNRPGMWARLIGRRANNSYTTSNMGDISASTQTTGFQGGVDLYRALNANGSATHFGISGGHASVDSAAEGDSISGDSKFEGWTASLHATHYNAMGWYADVLVQGAWLDVDASALGDSLSTDSKQWLVSLEMGSEIQTGLAGLVIEPQAQVIYLHKSIDTAHDGATQWAFDLDDAWIGRIGGRLKGTRAFEASPQLHWTGYAKANLWSNLSSNDAKISIENTLIGVAEKETWIDIGLGISAEATENVTLFADGDAEFGLGGDDHRAYTAKLGVRLNW